MTTVCVSIVTEAVDTQVPLEQMKSMEGGRPAQVIGVGDGNGDGDGDDGEGEGEGVDDGEGEGEGVDDGEGEGDGVDDGDGIGVGNNVDVVVGVGGVPIICSNCHTVSAVGKRITSSNITRAGALVLC